MTQEESRPPATEDRPETLAPDESTGTRRPEEYVNGCDSTTRRELAASAVDPEVARERGYRTIGRPGTADQRPRQEMQALGIPNWAIGEDRLFPGILIPVWGPSGRVVTHQWKPRTAVPGPDGKKRKYAVVKGQASRLDVHPRHTVLSDAVVPPIRDAGKPLLITEGVKKADSLTSKGFVAVALNGVFGWRSTLGTLGDWEDIALKGRKVGIVFDSDVVTNQQVRKAAFRLKEWLRSKGADALFFIPPATFNGRLSKGVDDFFVAGASADDFLKLGSPVLPEVEGVDSATFTDARLAERYAEESFAGSFIYASGMGWMGWTGKRWKRTADEVAINAMREHAVFRYSEALRWKADLIAAGKSPAPAQAQEEGWSGMLSANRLRNVFGLLKGIPELRREVSDFDARPDLLNTPDGVVNLRTGEIGAHDPDLLTTRTTAIGYDPAATDEAFSTALQSIPADAEEYLQTQLGQAITGHHGEVLNLLTGCGRNGKTKLMGALTGALGARLFDDAGYASIVPNTMLLMTKEKSGATPDKMTLLGLRFAFMEETPEDGHLNANTLKELVDADSISARQLYQQQVTFRPTHTLFLNTNHPPQVSSTDTAVWRRLRRVEFPYRFRLAGDGLGEWREGDKDGMAGMAEALSTESAQRAALAWLVAGAMRWYRLTAAGEMAPVPESVELAGRKWREETDDILAFVSEYLDGDAESWVWSCAFYKAFNAWQKGRGSTPMSQKTLMSRLAGHTALPATVGQARKRKGQDGHSAHPDASTGFASSTLGGSSGWEPDGARGHALTGVRWRR